MEIERHIENPEIYLSKWRRVSNLATIGIGIIACLCTFFYTDDINVIISFRTCSALMVLAGVWHMALVKIVPLLCSVASWVLTWTAYFMAYEYPPIRIWSYVFIAAGTPYLIYALLEFGNRLLEKEFGGDKCKSEVCVSKDTMHNKKITISATIASMICITLFIGILSYYILSSYHSVK